MGWKGKRKRGGKGGGKGNGGGKGAAGEGDQAGVRGDFPLDEVTRESEVFEKFYKEVFPAEDYDTIMASLRTDLPMTFRIHIGCTNTREQMENVWLPKLHGLKLDEEAVGTLEAPRPLAWYPDKMAWHVSFAKRLLRKNPLLKDFHNFLKREEIRGAISRQEAVSMVPPFFLDVQPHHKVLDMCAAPGMKTSQLLDTLTATSAEPAGVVVANDANRSRAFLLAHTLKRMRTPAFLVICHDGRQVPTVGAKDDEGKKTQMRFDRVLCDVPCSGDGTLRKAPDAWNKWAAHLALNLQKAQLGIAQRGAALLDIGGYLLYSTCSFNPLENEAVVAQLLNASAGALELQDVSDKLPELQRSPGMLTWPICGKNHVVYHKYTEEGADKHQLQPGYFAPDNAAELHLERCVRILPHVQDTGGFFICLIKKVGELPKGDNTWGLDAKKEAPTEEQPIPEPTAVEDAKKTEEAAAPTEEVDEAEVCRAYKVGKCVRAACKFVHEGAPAASMGRAGGNNDEQLVPLVGTEGGEAVIKSLVDFYSLPASFPLGQVFSRSANLKQLAYVSQATMELLKADERHRLNVVNCGVKLFERNDNLTSDCHYRVAQDGAAILLPYIGDRAVKSTLQFVFQLLQSANVSFEKAKSFDADTLERLEAIKVGSCVLHAEGPGKESFCVSIFRGFGRLSVFVPKEEAASMVEELRVLLPEAAAPAEAAEEMAMQE
eukprot:TRINITY_DN11908_c0_g1_i1.p1 TRINITY_DN11908_c0_g1~~TRINITY_DN11908_c0_g1_i1.p1  ORF type:complete len:715 (-),score=261.97 TRINITY_DN11908_c0_g1_i1:144-2288(-)